MIEKLIYEIAKNEPDHVATPKWIVEQVFSMINVQQFSKLWFPFDNYDSQFKIYADELKLDYKATHLYDGLGNDFFITQPPLGCDLMISNPPFSKQNEILKRSFELVKQGKIKSFALLLPLSTLETPKRTALYEKHIDKISILIYKKRIKFLNKNAYFNTACCWILYNIKTPNKIMFI